MTRRQFNGLCGMAETHPNVVVVCSNGRRFFTIEGYKDEMMVIFKIIHIEQPYADGKRDVEEVFKLIGSLSASK